MNRPPTRTARARRRPSSARRPHPPSKDTIGPPGRDRFDSQGTHESKVFWPRAGAGGPCPSGRVYTDGRAHPAPDDRWATYTGNNVGRWEKDTLVFHSLGLKGAGSTILGRNGVVMSDTLETTTRIRLLSKDRLLVTLVLVDPEALTRPWPVAFTYTRLPSGSTVYDYACAENNRNPITTDGRTLTLDPDGQVIDKAK